MAGGEWSGDRDIRGAPGDGGVFETGVSAFKKFRSYSWILATGGIPLASKTPKLHNFLVGAQFKGSETLYRDVTQLQTVARLDGS